MVATAEIEPCPEPFVTLAGELADAARRIILPYFRTRVPVDQKADLSPVTAADRETEALLRLMIADAYRDHGIVGEEYGVERAEASYVWVIDPIDGTKRFITANPLFGTLIALLRDGTPILGLIDLPVLGERWLGAAGRPTHYLGPAGEREITVRACPELSEAALAATSPQMFEGGDFEAFERLRKATKMCLYGGDCYNYAQLAEGFVDLVVEADMDPPDFLAAVPVIEGAGGIVTDWGGLPLGLGSDGRIVAAGDRRLHEATLGLLGSH